MSDALGLGPDFFAAMIDKPMASATVNRYPALTERPPADQFRGGAHTDYGTITLLATDGVPGLQLQDADGEWVHVDPVPNSFHVNTGDMLSHWSGGHWRSTWHRVVPPAGPPPYPSRTSIAYFHSPNADTVISPLPITVGSGRPRPPRASRLRTGRRRHVPAGQARPLPRGPIRPLTSSFASRFRAVRNAEIATQTWNDGEVLVCRPHPAGMDRR